MDEKKCKEVYGKMNYCRSKVEEFSFEFRKLRMKMVEESLFDFLSIQNLSERFEKICKRFTLYEYNIEKEDGTISLYYTELDVRNLYNIMCNYFNKDSLLLQTDRTFGCRITLYLD